MEKIPAPKGVSWGTTNVPKDKWLDLSKMYKTASGKTVESLSCILYNSLGEEVAYPLKGTVVLCKHPRKTRYTSWTLDGRENTLPQISNIDSESYNLVEV
jgi:hypothetical protein